jgi:hypothetical protein
VEGGLDREFRERFAPQDRIADRKNAAPALVIADGTRLEPLSRASRRQLEKDVAPWYAIPDKFGALVQRQLRLGAMDDRIFEVASGGRGADGWDREAFRRLFPEQERFLGRYDKRVETLRAIGYVTSEGHLAPEFRMHFAVGTELIPVGAETPSEAQAARCSTDGRARADGAKP